MKEIMKFYVPNDRFVDENIQSLLCSNGYATDKAEIQKLFIAEIIAAQKGFVEVIVEKNMHDI